MAENKTKATELGRHKMAKGCLYIRTMSDVNPKVLEKLVAGSIAAIRRRLPR